MDDKFLGFEDEFTKRRINKILEKRSSSPLKKALKRFNVESEMKIILELFSKEIQIKSSDILYIDFKNKKKL